MKKDLLFEELREVCEHMGYKLRVEKGDFSGGACVLKEERQIVLNKRWPMEIRLSTLAMAMGEIGIEDVFMKPAVRAYVEDEIAKRAV
jgi:hypothetical protein